MSEYKKIFIDQAAEYSSMGFLIKKKYKNSIILGADHFKMSQFYRIDTNIPVFYLSKFNILRVRGFQNHKNWSDGSRLDVEGVP